MSQHPAFVAAVTRPIDLHDAVRQYRSNEAALRRLALSRPTRNAGATNRAIARRRDERAAIELSLLLADRHELIGHLVDESKLLGRIAVARRLGQDRPELKARLAFARRRISANLPV